MTNTRPVPLSDLTDQQRAILAYLRQRCADGDPPTYEEIGDYLEISHVAVLKHVRVMRTKGFVQSKPRCSRSLRPTGKVPS